MLGQWTWWPEFPSWGSHGGRGTDDHKLSSDLDKCDMHFWAPLYMTYVCTCSVNIYVFDTHTCSAVALPDPFPYLGFPPFFHITAAKICCFGLGLWSRILYAQRVLIRLGILYTLKEGMFRSQRSIAEGSYSMVVLVFTEKWIKIEYTSTTVF